MLFFSYEMKSS